MQVKKREVAILMVVNMFLTDFYATAQNTPWVDKNLKKYLGVVRWGKLTCALFALRGGCWTPVAPKRVGRALHGFWTSWREARSRRAVCFKAHAWERSSIT